MMLSEASRLAELGFRVFPCRPCDKTPATAHGFHDGTIDLEQVATWWDCNPEFNVAIATAGMLVIDIDVKHGPCEWHTPETAERLLASCGAASRTPSGGWHYYYRQPAGADLRSTTSKIAPNVDTRANGGYVVCPPSVIAGVGLYSWIPGCELDCPPESLPEPPEWLLQALAATDKPKSKEDDSGRSWASSDPIPDGQRNQTLTSLAGYLRDAGMSQSAIEAALRATNAERCNPPLDDAEVRKIAWSVARYEPSQSTVANAEGWANIDAASAQQDHTVESDPGEIPESLIRPGGFLGELFDWTLRTAPRPQPEFALAGALCVLSTLTGRKIRDDSGIRGNLYTVAVGETSGGKDWPRVIAKRVFANVGMQQCLLEDIKSGPGVTSALSAHPVRLVLWDEFGRALEGMTTGGRNAPWLQTLMTMLLKMFTSAGSTYAGEAQADASRMQTIFDPHLSVFGCSTVNGFFASLNSDTVQNGTLNRSLVFFGRPDVRLRNVTEEEPPQAILDYAEYWRDYRPGGNLHGCVSDAAPETRRLSYAPDAADVITEYINQCEDRRHRIAHEWERALRGRQVELAKRLAMLHAVSVSRETTTIDAHSASWACNVVEHLANRMVWHSSARIASSTYEAQLKELVRFVTECGAAGATKTTIARKFQRFPSKLRSELLQHAAEAGQVIFEKIETEGAPRCVFKARQFVAAM